MSQDQQQDDMNAESETPTQNTDSETSDGGEVDSDGLISRNPLLKYSVPLSPIGLVSGVLLIALTEFFWVGVALFLGGLILLPVALLSLAVDKFMDMMP